MIILWLVCGAATVIAAALAGRSRQARFIGRAAVGLLAVFEATAGVLAISGARRTQLGYLAVIAFYLALWPFGWIETMWVLIMLPSMLLLLRAERRAIPAARGGTPAAALQHA
jgi:hypothetical protein